MITRRPAAIRTAYGLTSSSDRAYRTAAAEVYAALRQR